MTDAALDLKPRPHPSFPSWMTSVFLKLTMKRHVRKGVDLQAMRADGEARAAKWRPPSDIVVTDVPDGPLKGLNFKPAAGVAGPTLLYTHGGGYSFCSPRTHAPLCAALCRQTKGEIHSIQYPLAPENTLPAQLDDAKAAWEALLAGGLDPKTSAFGGDSAGGHLALTLLLACKQEGLPLPAAAILFSPWTDLTASGASLDSNEQSCAMFTAKSIRENAVRVRGDLPATDWRASPLFADLSGLPPLVIYVSTAETLRDDGTRLAERARQAGVTVELQEWRGQPHVWPVFANLPEAKTTHAHAAAFIRRHTGFPAAA